MDDFFDGGFDLGGVLEGYFGGGEVGLEEAVVFAGGYVVVQAFVEGTDDFELGGVGGRGGEDEVAVPVYEEGGEGVVFGVFGGDDVVVVGTGGEDLGDVGDVDGGGGGWG